MPRALEDSTVVAFPGARAADPAPWRAKVAPACVYLLADHLDAALAAGEDLTAEGFEWNCGECRKTGDITASVADQRAAIETIRSLEMILVARVLKSRERAEELARRDTRFKPVFKLYSSGTATLIEAVSEFSDSTLHDFETGDATLSYLRTRGLLAGDAAGIADGTPIRPNDDFLIARRIRLGSLLDLVATFLDALEAHYDLFAEGEDAAEFEAEENSPAPHPPEPQGAEALASAPADETAAATPEVATAAAAEAPAQSEA